jgi:hypothetical protein
MKVEVTGIMIPCYVLPDANCNGYYVVGSFEFCCCRMVEALTYLADHSAVKKGAEGCYTHCPFLPREEV